MNNPTLLYATLSICAGAFIALVINLQPVVAVQLQRRADDRVAAEIAAIVARLDEPDDGAAAAYALDLD